MSSNPEESSFVLHGDVCCSADPKTLFTSRNAWLVCENGLCRGSFDSLPEAYVNLPVKDYGNQLIFPGLTDLHIHAPQFAYRGTGMDLELLDWLKTYTFPEEARYGDTDYARRAYGIFARTMKASATTRSVIFATRHRAATEILMEEMEQTGLISYVGKVNMDRNSIPELQEAGYMASAYDTFGWINRIRNRFVRTKPILTPRFVPACSDGLMNELREIQRAYGLPVQSHLSENRKEIELVRALCPDTSFYGQAYDRWGLFGGDVKTVMAHCVYSGPEEVALLCAKRVFVAHCPASNINLASGIAPIRNYLRLNMRVGLGSDVAGGQGESILAAAVCAVQASKMYWRLVDRCAEPLTFSEAFYLATAGGGAFFGDGAGTFAPGAAFDAVVLDDRGVETTREFTVADRMERAAYLSLDQTCLKAKYVKGVPVFERN